MWVQYEPNPATTGAADCAVRAVAKALDTDWETAYVMLSLNGFLMGDVMNANHVIGSVLHQNGFVRSIIPNTCPDCYTVADFIADHPQGTFVLGFGDHVATVQDGSLFDSWDSSQRIPIYFWERKDDD